MKMKKRIETSIKGLLVLLCLTISSVVWAQEIIPITLSEIDSHINDSVSVCGDVKKVSFSKGGQQMCISFSRWNGKKIQLNLKAHSARDIRKSEWKGKYICISGKLLKADNCYYFNIYSKQQLTDVMAADIPSVY